MKKKWMSGALALLLAGTTVASMVPAFTVNAEGQDTATGTTYYVDSKSGSDSNDGTSESKAFKTLDKVNALNLEPGDTVLLKKGSVFEDQALQFTKEDSGTAEKVQPIPKKIKRIMTHTQWIEPVLPELQRIMEQ